MARDVFRVAGKLWNLTYVARAGRYIAWRLLRLIGLHNSGGSKTPNRTARLGSEFHADVHFWECTIDHELIHEGETLSDPFYTAIQRPAKEHHLSDSRWEAVGGFCVERKVFWMYILPKILPKELTAELKRKADRRETCTITIKLFIVLGRVTIAWVMLELIGDRADEKGDPNSDAW